MPERSARFRASAVRDAALIVLGVAALIWILQSAQEVFVPILLAILVSTALDPLVSRVERIGIPRFLSAAVLLGALVGVLAFGAWVLQDDFITMVEDLPQVADRVRESLKVNGEGGVVEKVEEAATAIESTAAETASRGQAPAPEGIMRVQIIEKPLDMSGILLWGSMGALSAMAYLALLFFLTYFLLLSGNLFRAKLVRIAGPRLSDKKVTVEILQDIQSSVARYVLVMAFTGLLVGVASGLAFRWIGLERAFFWGVAAGVFNSVPYFGPLLVAIGVAVAAFLQFGTLEMVLVVVAIAAVITTIEGMLLTPLMVGRAARMNGVAVFVGLLFWSWLWGVWGMLLAAPVLAIIKCVCDRIENLKPVGELLGE